MIVNMDIFGGIGADADGFINRNTSNVNSCLSNICEGLLKIDNRVYMINQQRQNRQYYAESSVSRAYKNDGEYFVENLQDNPFVYDNNRDKCMVIGDESGDMNHKVTFDNNVKTIGLTNDAIEYINDNVDLLNELGFDDSSKLCDFEDNGLNFNEFKDMKNEYYYNKNTFMANGFLYFGFGSNVNEEYHNINGTNMENPLFCQGGVIFEAYPDYFIRLLADKYSVFNYTRTSYCSEKMGKYSNYSDKFIIMTSFLKFKRLWLFVSIDLKLLLQEFIVFMRSDGIHGISDKEVKKLENIKFSLSYAVTLLKGLSKYLQSFLWILRSFGVGYEMYDTLFKLSCDFSSCSIGISAYKNLCY